MSKEIKIAKVIDNCGDDCVYYDSGKDVGGGNYAKYCRNNGSIIDDKALAKDGFPSWCLLENSGGKYSNR